MHRAPEGEDLNNRAVHKGLLKLIGLRLPTSRPDGQPSGTFIRGQYGPWAQDHFRRRHGAYRLEQMPLHPPGEGLRP